MSDAYWWPGMPDDDEGPRRPMGRPEPPPAAAVMGAAKSVADATRGLTDEEKVPVLKELLTHAAAALQGVEGHVETSETIYRLGDCMAVSCGVPDWREI